MHWLMEVHKNAFLLLQGFILNLNLHWIGKLVNNQRTKGSFSLSFKRILGDINVLYPNLFYRLGIFKSWIWMCLWIQNFSLFFSELQEKGKLLTAISATRTQAILEAMNTLIISPIHKIQYNTFFSSGVVLRT